MSRDEEYMIADTKGRFAQAVKNGRPINDASWTPGRVVLSNKRLVSAGNEGKRTIPLSDVDELGGRHDVSQEVQQVSNYVSFRLGENALLVEAEDHDEFQTNVYQAFLDRRVIYARHPTVAGGVVRDAEWEKARLKIEADGVSVAMESGDFVRLEPDDIGTLETAE